MRTLEPLAQALGREVEPDALAEVRVRGALWMVEDARVRHVPPPP